MAVKRHLKYLFCLLQCISSHVRKLKFYSFFYSKNFLVTAICPIQGWYKFLDPKFKTFSRLFSKTIICFSRLTVVNWVINTDLKRQSFLHSALHTNARDWIRFDQHEKISLLKYFSAALRKKKKDFLPFFQTLSPFSRLFPGLGNCWANFKTFSRIQDSVWTPHIEVQRSSSLQTLHHHARFSLSKVVQSKITWLLFPPHARNIFVTPRSTGLNFGDGTRLGVFPLVSMVVVRETSKGLFFILSAVNMWARKSLLTLNGSCHRCKTKHNYLFYRRKQWINLATGKDLNALTKHPPKRTVKVS